MGMENDGDDLMMNILWILTFWSLKRKNGVTWLGCVKITPNRRAKDLQSNNCRLTSMEHLSRNGGQKMLKTQHVPSWSLGQGAVGVTCDAIVPTETSFRSAGRWNVRHARHPIALLASAGNTKTKHFNNKRTLPRDTPMTFCAACRSNDQSNQRIYSFPNQTLKPQNNNDGYFTQTMINMINFWLNIYII